MKFRPCIDIHNGKVKQIVGGSLRDAGTVSENFVSDQDGSFFGEMYRNLNLPGGHIILLNPAGTEEYEKDIEQAKLAFSAYPGGLMIGGGITAENAESFLDMGATHVIVTSYVFKNGRVDMKRLEKLRNAVGKERLVLDLSCRRRHDPAGKTDENKAGRSYSKLIGETEARGDYFIVTDRWQKYTDVPLTIETLDMFSEYASEFLIHAVDVEGKARGIEEDVATLLGGWGRIPVTYAGGVGSFEDLKKLKELGRDRLDVTIGSALSIFGGSMELADVVRYISKEI